MQGSGVSLSSSIVALAETVWKSQYSCSLVDTQHGDTFRCGKANLRQRVQRVLPAEISTYHLQAGYATLHRIMLMYDFYFLHLKRSEFTFYFSDSGLHQFPYTCFLLC